jgi:hypothetical protein
VTDTVLGLGTGGVLDQVNGLTKAQAGGDAGDTRNGAEARGVQNRCREQRKYYPGYHDWAHRLMTTTCSNLMATTRSN